MRRAIDLLGEGGEQDVRVVGSPKTGCRHCGANVRHLSEDGKVVVYRPATDCCWSAIEDQVGYVRDAISGVRARLAERETELARLYDEIAVTESKARGEALQRRAQRADAHMPELRAQLAGEIADLTGEIKRLRALQARLNHDLGL